MNDYKGVSGLVYPENGTPLFQEDFQTEAELIGKDINVNYTDIFTAGVLDGFDFSAGSGIINIGSGLARDSLGRRVFLATDAGYEPPDGETVDVVARHRWITEDYVPDGSSDVKQKRVHSCEIVHIAAESSPESGDVPIVRIARSGASVVIVQDLRIDIRLRERFYEYMDKRFGLDFINSYGKYNLVYNGDFSIDSGLWSNGNTSHPDGWISEDPDISGTQISKDSDGTIRLVAGTITTYYRFQQNIHEFPGWAKYLKGKRVTICFKVKTASSTVLIKVYDGINTAQQVVSGAATGKEFLLTLNVSENAICLRVMVEMVTSNDVVNIISIGANLGQLYVYDQPCIIQGNIGEIKTYDATEIAPAGEFELNGIELPAGYTRLDSFLNGKFGLGNNGRSKLRNGQGKFERQWAHGSGNDPDRASRANRGDGVIGDKVGTTQSDAIRNITGQLSAAQGKPFALQNDTNSALYVPAVYGGSRNSGAAWGSDSFPHWTHFDASRVVPVGLDNRPKNDAVLKTIRWC